MTKTNTNNDRRKPADRRTSSDRRRPSEGRFVTIELCRSQLHMAVVAREARGDGDLLLCRSYNWRVEADSLLAPGGAEELKDAFKQLVVEERLSGASTTVILNSDLCVSRVAVGSSTQVDEEISELTERSQLYLALGAGEKAAATARFHLDARHEHAILSVANQKTVNAVVGAAEAAGLELRAVEASAVALCRAHGELYNEAAPVILAQLNDGGVEFMLSHNGRLLLEHRVGGDTTPEQFANLLKQHHGRLVRYCQHQGLGGDSTLARAYLAGDPKLVEAAQRHLTKDSPIDAQPFSIEPAKERWVIRDDPPQLEHTAALGGAYAGVDGTNRSGPNLLERWIAESRKHIRPMLIRSAIPMVATLLIAAGLWLVNQQQASHNAHLSEQLAKLRPTRLEADRLRTLSLQSRAKIDQLSKLSEQTPSSELTVLLNRVGGCLPHDVWLDQLILSKGKAVSIRGAAYTESGAFDFVSHLNKAPRMSQVALEETGESTGGNGPTTTFRVKANYAQNASEPAGDSIASKAAVGRK